MVVNYSSYNVTTYITKKIKEEGSIYIYIHILRITEKLLLSNILIERKSFRVIYKEYYKMT